MEHIEGKSETGAQSNRVTFEAAPEGINQALYIEQPDATMRQIVHRVLGNQDSTSEAYRMCKRVGAFFQMGYEPDSEEIMIEFWKGDGADHLAFMDFLKEMYQNAEEVSE